MLPDLVNDLRAEIAKGQVLVVVGAGVSIGATGDRLASWTGLLESGVQQCVAIQGLDPSWADIVQTEIHSGDMDNLLSAAEKISRKLGSPSGPEYRCWLRETVGALKAKDRSVLDALRDLNLPLATTNYDGLLEEITGFPAVTWSDGDKALRVIKREENGILHLHGHWDKPDTVVLGIRSYEEIRRDKYAQAVLQALRTLSTLLFVGCGEGLSDPNFDALLLWARETFKDVGGRHYRLCQESDLELLRTFHRSDHIHPLSYGPNHSELADFIGRLGAFAPKPEGGKQDNDLSLGSALQPIRLPSRPQYFGREKEVRDLVESLLQPSPSPIPVLGGPGAGKTTIVLAALHDSRVEARFEARRFFVRCDGTHSREALVGAIARTIGLKPGPNVETSLFDELESRPALLVLDNAETPWEVDPAQVSELLASLTSLKTLALVVSIRGRQRPLGPSWRSAIQVESLELPEAKRAFLAVAGEHFVNDPDLNRLLEAVDCLPLAVVLLAHEAEGEPSLASLWRRWREKRTALLSHTAGKESNLEASLDLSIQSPRMTSAARKLLSVIAHLPDGIAHTNLETSIACEGEAAASVLRKVGLAFDHGRRMRALAPIREYVKLKLPITTADTEISFTHYLALAEMGALVGRSGGAEAAAIITEESGNIEAMLRLGLNLLNPEPAIVGALQYGAYIRFTGLGDRSILEEALKVSTSLERPDLSARCAERLGEIAFYKSEHSASLIRYEEALRLYRMAGDKEGEINCIKSLGNIHLARSNHEQASARFKEALLLYQQSGSIIGEANCLRSIGDIALERFNYDSAQDLFERSLLLYRKSGDLRGQAKGLQSLGDILLLRSEHESACALYEEARSLYLQVGDALGEANSLLSLGDIYLDQFNLEAARTHYKTALDIYQKVGAVLGTANCITGLGGIALELTDYDTARSYLKSALSLFQDCGSTLGQGHCIKGLGDVSLGTSDYQAAYLQYEEALSLYQHVGSILGQANCILSLGDVLLHYSDPKTARKKFLEALSLYQRIKRPCSIGESQLRLARLAPIGSKERQDHVRQAMCAWASIKRNDLVEKLRVEFGELS